MALPNIYYQEIRMNKICQKVDARFSIMKLSFFSASENIIHQLKSSDHFGGTSTLAISQQIL